MTVFLRLIADRNKASILSDTCSSYRAGNADQRIFNVDPKSFVAVAGAPFAYWFSTELLKNFRSLDSFEQAGFLACVTNQVGDDTRFYRAFWEVTNSQDARVQWLPLTKGGAFSPYHHDVHLVVSWNVARGTYLGFVGTEHRPLEKPASADNFFRPGLTWPRRTQQFGVRVLPRGCIFSNKGPGVFVEDDISEDLLALVSLMNSSPFKILVSTRLNAGDSTARSFEVGIIQDTPVPPLSSLTRGMLCKLGRVAWSLKRRLIIADETSREFVLPATLMVRLGDHDVAQIESKLADTQKEIDEVAFGIYGFNNADRTAALEASGFVDEGESHIADGSEDAEEDDVADAIDQTDGLVSWAVGVAFGRFDWRLATGEREAPPEPDPFDPLPAKSPGMLPDGAAPFHAHGGILVDDQGHPHDLPRLIEEVLARVQVDVPGDVRRWLQRDFFPLHLKQYSKSRRKAPIYWPLSTTSGSYTLWLYYPSLTSQTLYTAINDFIEPRLQQVGRDANALRNKGSARSREDEKSFEALQTLEIELTELRDLLHEIAPTYPPNHDDGVQITAAPLWRLFRHKPWQKVLKDTWQKLEKGDYDWAHLAMAYWPERVREKCKTDKSLAIAHELEHLYEEPAEDARGTRGRKKAGGTG